MQNWRFWVTYLSVISDQSFDHMVDILSAIQPGLKAFKKSDLDLSNQLR